MSRLLLFGLIFAALVLLWQWRSGCYQGDLAGNPDEPAHVISSLLIRDYVADGMPEAPIPFARNYYVHYPKVAIGHWPPLFHVAEAMWMLLFGRTQAAMLALVAVSAIALLICVFAWVSRRCGTVAGFFAAVTLMLPMAMREAMDSVEPDIVLVLLSFLAAAAYGRFLEDGRRKYVFVFWILAAAAMATHGRGAALCFLPAVTALTLRRFRQAWFSMLFSVAVIISATFVPHWLGQAYRFSPHEALANMWIVPLRVIAACGWPVAVVAILGCVAIFRARQVPPEWHAVGALVLSSFLFYILVNVPVDGRYLMPTVPAIAAFFGAGIASVARIAKARWHVPFAGGALAALACGAAIPLLHISERKYDPGIHRMVNAGRVAGIATRVYLISGDPQYEGALIVDIALADARLDHVVLRASKVLFHSAWLGTYYRLLFNDSPSMAAWFDQARVGAIILQKPDPRPHLPQLLSTIERPGSPWVRVNDPRIPAAAEVFRRAPPPPTGGRPNIRIDMRADQSAYFDLRY